VPRLRPSFLPVRSILPHPATCLQVVVPRVSDLLCVFITAFSQRGVVCATGMHSLATTGQLDAPANGMAFGAAIEGDWRPSLPPRGPVLVVPLTLVGGASLSQDAVRTAPNRGMWICVSRSRRAATFCGAYDLTLVWCRYANTSIGQLSCSLTCNATWKWPQSPLRHHCPAASTHCQQPRHCVCRS
jgi:hypothetical protein